MVEVKYKLFSDKNIKNLILINPDNPSGNYIEKTEVLRIAKWAEDKNISFIVHNLRSKSKPILHKNLESFFYCSKNRNMVQFSGINI